MSGKALTKLPIMAYDAANHAGIYGEGHCRGTLKDDPLPGIERSLPEAEFLSAAQPLRTGRGHGLDSMITFDPWALAKVSLCFRWPMSDLCSGYRRKHFFERRNRLAQL